MLIIGNTVQPTLPCWVVPTTGSLSITDALIRVEEEVPMSDEIRSLVKFIRSSEKGIV